jgi:hypothetical protein
MPPSPEDGNRSSFQNVIFSSYLEFRFYLFKNVLKTPTEVKKETPV